MERFFFPRLRGGASTIGCYVHQDLAHDMATTHAEVIDKDVLAFIQG